MQKNEQKEKVGLLEREAKLFQGWKNAADETRIIPEPYAAAHKILGYNLDAKTFAKFVEMGLITKNEDGTITVNEIDYNIIPNRIKKAKEEKEDVNLEKIIPKEGWFQIKSKSQIETEKKLLTEKIAINRKAVEDIDTKICQLQKEKEKMNVEISDLNTKIAKMLEVLENYDLVMSVACIVDGGENEKC